MTEVINLDDILKNKCVFSMGNTSCINPHHWIENVTHQLNSYWMFNVLCWFHHFLDTHCMWCTMIYMYITALLLSYCRTFRPRTFFLKIPFKIYLMKTRYYLVKTTYSFELTGPLIISQYTVSYGGTFRTRIMISLKQHNTCTCISW